MKIEQVQHGTVLVLVPDGALIEDDAQDFARQVRDCLLSGHNKLIIQLNNVPFIDSAGLETLLVLFGEAMAQGGEIKISTPTDIGRDILKATRLNHVIEVHSSTPDARRSFV